RRAGPPAEQRAEPPVGRRTELQTAAPTEPPADAPTERGFGAPPPGTPGGTGSRRRPSRRTAVIASALAGVLAAGAVAGGLYYLGRPSGGRTPSGPAAFPDGPLLVGIDTAPGWPESCHADIGLFRPGEAAATTLAGGG